MGRKCCVPGCKSNYNSETVYTPVFSFPKEEKLQKHWVRSINRSNFKPSATAVVCVKHFDERFVIKEDKVVRADGSLLIVSRKKLGLTPDAFPTIFENQPIYLSKELPPKRKSPCDREKEILDRDEENFKRWCTEDVITSYDEFHNKCSCKLPIGWLMISEKNFIVFYKLEVTDYPKVTVSFKINNELAVSVWNDNIPVEGKSLEWLLGPDQKCDKWTKFDSMLTFLPSYSSSVSSFTQNLSAAIHCLKQCCHDLERNIDTKENDQADEVNGTYLKVIFLQEQMSLLLKQQVRYSTDTLLWATKLFFSYPAAYYLVRNSGVLTLPHPSYLKKLSSLNSTNNEESNINYLQKKASLLSNNEKIINLLIDEIYVTPNISYKGGQLVGVAANSNNEATTIQAFMLTSLFSKNKDIVSLIPVKNLTAEILYDYTLQVLKILNDCGFIVVSIISDNNKVNNKMFGIMCDGELSHFIPNPICPEKKLFLLFDSVHLIKSIRNNWLNQVTDNQSFFYPNIDDFSKISCASLSHLKTIYECEKNKIVKQAPRLSRKVLYPTSTERQNVRHALNIFHETNSCALTLNHAKLENPKGTSNFISHILKWWKILNVQKPHKGLLNRDEYSDQIESPFDKNVKFLKHFASWLVAWNEHKQLKGKEKIKQGLPTKGGGLSKETQFALHFTTQGFVELIFYVFEQFKPSYILLGKFQTDNLEARFGQYRQMSGGNYHISFRQIVESEQKLKIMSLISLYSQKLGEFKIKDLRISNAIDSLDTYVVPNEFFEVFNSYDDEVITKSTMSVLIYIAGYVGHKVAEKINCFKCVSLLIQNKNLELSDIDEDVSQYLRLLDRGGLKWPQELTVQVICETFQIFSKLIKRKHEEHFLKCGKQRNVVIYLTLEKLHLLNSVPDVICSCGAQCVSLVKKCIFITSNIFLNNYTKVENDNFKSFNQKRKISTFGK